MIEIKYATKEDINALVGFQVLMAKESEGSILNIEKVTNGITQAISDPNKGRYLVAKIDGETVGSLMLTSEWSDWNAQWYLWIQSVYVIPQHRGQGIYTAMYQKVKDIAKEENISQVRLYVDKTNIAAQKVYNKLGMTQSHYLIYEENI